MGAGVSGPGALPLCSAIHYEPYHQPCPGGTTACPSDVLNRCSGKESKPNIYRCASWDDDRARLGVPAVVSNASRKDPSEEIIGSLLPGSHHLRRPKTPQHFYIDDDSAWNATVMPLTPQGIPGPSSKPGRKMSDQPVLKLPEVRGDKEGAVEPCREQSLHSDREFVQENHATEPGMDCPTTLPSEVVSSADQTAAADESKQPLTEDPSSKRSRTGSFVGEMGSSACNYFFFFEPGAFLQLCAPNGQRWEEYCLHAQPTITKGTATVSLTLSGPWAECIHAAVVYENSNPEFAKRDDYAMVPPAQQVIDFFEACGHSEQTPALEEAKRATLRLLTSSAASGISSSRCSSRNSSRGVSEISIASTAR